MLIATDNKPLYTNIFQSTNKWLFRPEGGNHFDNIIVGNLKENTEVVQ